MKIKKYKLIANPAAGRGRSRELIARIVEIFESRRAAFDLDFTRGPGDAAGMARESTGEFDVIVVIGGDGSINDIIPGMLFSPRPLGIIPTGSGNDFIKSLNISSRLESAVDTVLKGEARVIDVGTINGRFFANGVGMGFDAAVNKASYAINHSKQGLLLYVCALVRTLGKYDPVAMKITMNGETFAQDTFLLTVGNGTTVGGGFKLTPHAMVDDALLDVTIVRPLGLPMLLWHLPKVFLGTIDRVKYASLHRTGRLIVETNGPVPVHLDGEIYSGDGNRFEIEIIPRALRVIGNFPG
jgi:YegS/Rv2252/BmrU family lipid kinase